MDNPHRAAGALASEAHSQWTVSSLEELMMANNALHTAGGEFETQAPGLTTDRAVIAARIKTPAAQHPNLPINRLPVELLLSIFHQDDSKVKRRLVLSHVCHRWRAIALASGSLWTNIEINPTAHPTNKRFQNLISLLSLQFERSQGLSLNVFWRIWSQLGRINGIVNLIRHKGNFSRWKCLTLSITINSSINILPGDSFHNLETLVVLSARPHVILTTLNVTTTSQLQTLDLSESGTSYEMIETLYGTMLKRISRLVLPTVPGNTVPGLLPPIPPNVVYLESRLQWYHPYHPFPYVETYKLELGTFEAGIPFDLRNLTTLVVSSSIIVMMDCRVVLPSLLRFVCGGITLGQGVVMEAPALNDLEFREDKNPLPGLGRSYFGYVEAVLDHPGFLLSPTKSLLVEMPLPSDVLLKMLTQYPHLETLDLKFNDNTSVWRVADVIGGNFETTGIICPRLSELKLRFAREYGSAQSPWWWKQRATRMLQGRKGCAALNIYGAWRGGETFMLLT